jgi:hypothetical protein
MRSHARLDFDQTIRTLNQLLSRKQPELFSSSWILRHAPHCYRFICRHVRHVSGRIDWDRVTCALDPKFQRRWFPGRRSCLPYRDSAEVAVILNHYRDKLYVFLAPADSADRRIRDVIGISLVRLAQKGNIIARREALKLVDLTVSDWLEHNCFLCRWRGFEDEVRKHIEGCIQRYRYTGSFLNYVFMTLVCAARGIRPIYAHSLDEPILDGEMCRMDTIGYDPASDEIRVFRRP